MKNNVLRLQIGGSSLTTRPTWCTRNVASKQKWMTSRGLSWKPVANFSSSSIQPQKRYVPNAHMYWYYITSRNGRVICIRKKYDAQIGSHNFCVCRILFLWRKNESRADLIWVSGLATGGFEDAGRGFELASSDVCPPPSGGETNSALGHRMCCSKNQKVSYFTTYYVYLSFQERKEMQVHELPAALWSR
jgi:hypothetical protein